LVNNYSFCNLTAQGFRNSLLEFGFASLVATGIGISYLQTSEIEAESDILSQINAKFHQVTFLSTFEC
jgi:hypothetical protein